MDETGQPGAAAPGENGNGAGPHGDLARPANGWAAADSGWPNVAKPIDGGSESRPQWRQSTEPAVRPSWADPASRYADPTVPTGVPRESGQPTDEVTFGDRHYPDPSTVPFRAPASASPYPYHGDPEDFGPERIAVPAPRPASVPDRSTATPDRSRRRSGPVDGRSGPGHGDTGRGRIVGGCRVGPARVRGLPLRRRRSVRWDGDPCGREPG